MLKLIRDYLKPTHQVDEPVPDEFVPITNNDLKLNSFGKSQIQTIFLNVVFAHALSDIYLILNDRKKVIKSATDKLGLAKIIEQKDQIELMLSITKDKYMKLCMTSQQDNLNKTYSIIISKDFYHNQHVHGLKQLYDDNKTGLLLDLDRFFQEQKRIILEFISGKTSDSAGETKEDDFLSEFSDDVITTKPKIRF